MSNVTPVTKRVTMLTSAQKSQKTSGDLGGLHVDDWENGKIGTGILYSVPCYLQGPDRGPARLRKRSQCNDSGFCVAARPQDLQDQHWSSED